MYASSFGSPSLGTSVHKEAGACSEKVNIDMAPSMFLSLGSPSITMYSMVTVGSAMMLAE